MNRRFIKQVGLLRWIWRYGCWQWHKRVLRHDPWLQLPAGALYRCPRWDPFAAEAFVTGGDVDWGAEDLLARLLRPEQTVLDVGAHTGYYAQRLAPFVAQVQLFEPDPRCFAWLQEHFGHDTRFKLWNVAVADASGELELRSDGRGFSHDSGAGQVYQVRALRLDDEVAQFGQVGAIKIDIDGPDMAVLHGAQQLIREQQPLLLLEIGNFQPAPLARWLLEQHYRLLALREPTGLRFAGLDQVQLEPWTPERMKMVFAVPVTRIADLLDAAAALGD